MHEIVPPCESELDLSYEVFDMYEEMLELFIWKHTDSCLPWKFGTPDACSICHTLFGLSWFGYNLYYLKKEISENPILKSVILPEQGFDPDDLPNSCKDCDCGKVILKDRLKILATYATGSLELSEKELHSHYVHD